MTKNERQALINYIEFLRDMKRFFENDFEETGDVWSHDRAEEYKREWATAERIRSILNDKDDLEFWANAKV